MKKDTTDQGEPLTLIEAAAYLKVSVHTMHKWTSRGTIPSYKPNGRVLYFKREELDAWVFRNRNVPAYEMGGAK